jgi:hypothetical protein
MLCRTFSIDSLNDSTGCSSNVTEYSDNHFHFFIERKNIALLTLDNLDDIECNLESTEDSSYSKYNSNVVIVSTRSIQSNFEEKLAEKVMNLELKVKLCD